MRNNYAINQGSPPIATSQHRTWVLSLWLLLCLMASSAAVFGQTVTSDKDDYAPGEVATITGSGWTADEMVHVEFKEEPDYPDYHIYDVPVDNDGNWVIKYDIERRHIGVKFTVTAKGQQSGSIATTVFTDAANDKYTPSISPTAVCSGTSTSFKLRLTATSGNTLMASVIVSRPAGTYSSVSAIAYSPAGVQKGSSWANDFTPTATHFKFKSPNSASNLSNNNGEYLEISFTTSLSSNYTWVTSAFTNNTYSTASNGTVNNEGTDPTVIVNPLPTTAIAGADQTVNGTSTTLAGNPPTVGTGTWSIVSSTGGSIVAPTSPTSTFTGAAGTSYTLRWTISNGTCTASTDDVTITFANPNNPLPVLTSISPTSKTVGDATFTLTVNGSNFINGSVVRLDGNSRTTTFVSSTQLTASIPASDLTSAGSKSITVFTSTPGGGTSGAINLTVNQAQPTISWADAGTITYSTDLTGKLNATATYNGNTVLGTFVYKADGVVVSNSFVLDAKTTAFGLTVDFTPSDATNYKTASGTNSIIVNKASQNITFAALTDKTFGDASFDLGATASSGLAVSYTSSNTAVATVSGNTVTIESAGTTTITAAQPGNTNYNAATAVPQTLKITPATATISVTDLNKTYNGSAQGATVITTPAGLAVNVTYAGSATVPTAAGTYAIVAALNNSNYSAANGTGSLVIAPKPLTPSFTAADKEYDGNTNATVTGYSVTGKVGTEDVNISGGTASFDNKNVGTAKIVTLTGATLTGTAAGNYSLTSTTATTEADITPLAITGSFTASNKVYDGNATAEVTERSLDGVLGIDKVTLTGGTSTFNNKNVGTGKTVTLTGANLDGDDKGNYSLASVATTTADIRAKPLTASISAQDKEYDGTSTASATGSVPTAEVINGDEVNVTVSGANFDNKNVGTGKTVTADVSINNNNYSLTSASASTTANITAKALVIAISATDKVYDGNATASVSASIGSDLVDGDQVSVAATNGAFNDKNVGTGKAVTASVSKSGADAGNYTANTTANTTASITAKQLVVSAAGVNKVYDGNATATVTLSDDRVTGDVLTTAYASAAFDNKNVGTSKTVSVSGISISGTDVDNYTANTTASTTANITVRDLSLSDFVAGSKVYDGNTDVLSGAGFEDNRVAGDQLTFSYNVAFADKYVGTGKDVNFTSIAISGGADEDNYTLKTTSGVAKANITVKTLVIAITATDKVYDGNTTAAVSASIASGLVDGDDVTVSASNGAFNDKNVGTGKTVTASVSKSGADAGNYSANTTASTTATITARELVVSASGINKVYDGNMTATVTLSDNRVTGDVLTTAYASATFNNKNVGTGKTVTVNGISVTGTDAGNYTANTTAATTANITAKPLVVSATGIDKVYDGNATANVTLSTDKLASDDVTAAYTSATFADKNVGTGKAVSVSGISISGDDAGNYSFNTTASTTADITPLGITGSFTMAASKVYDGTTTATVTGRSLNGVVASDVVTLTGGTATFADKNVGTGKTVTLTGASLIGTAAGNYSLSSVNTTTADITKRTLVVSATGVNKVYDGTTAATVTLSDNRVPGDALILAYTSATFANANVGTGKAISVSGISTSGTHAGNYSFNTTASTTANITVATSTTTLITSAGTVRFMDNLTMTAQIKPLNTGSALTGTVEFKIGDVNYGTATVVPVPGALDGSVKATLIKQVSNLPGNYTVTAVYTSTNPNYSGGSDNKQLTVTQRNATPRNVNAGFYTGDVFAWTTSSSSSKATVTLIASLKDNEVPGGDLRAAKVTFYYVNGTTLTPIPSAKDLPVGLVDVNDGTVGFASAIVQFDIGSNNALDYVVAVGVSGAYRNNANDPLSKAIITVSKPVPGGYIVGGSQLTNIKSNGYVRGHNGYNTDYQFDIAYTKSGSNPKGKAKVMVRSYYKPDGTLDNKLHTYVISTNAIATLNISKNGDGTAIGNFTAKANLDEYIDNGTTTTIVPIEGGATFQMEASQKSCDQQLAITLYRKAGGIWFSSNFDGSKTVRQAVCPTSRVFVEGGGPCTTTPIATARTSAEPVTAQSVEPIQTNMYPNPFFDKFTISFGKSITQEVLISIVDMKGTIVFQKEIAANSNASEVEIDMTAYRSGTYIVQTIIGSERQVTKVIKY